MYLISLYFDPKTEQTLKNYRNSLAQTTSNDFMVKGNIPPHITLLEFDALDEELVLDRFRNLAKDMPSGEVQLASLGVFKKQSIFIQPVLNQYLHDASQKTFDAFADGDRIIFSPYYKPYGWIPHVSMAKHLEKDEMEKAFSYLLQEFAPLNAKVARIGLAKTNPHRDIEVYDLT